MTLAELKLHTAEAIAARKASMANACPACKAKPGEICLTPYMMLPLELPHPERALLTRDATETP